jgi:hypothetical protein
LLPPPSLPPHPPPSPSICRGLYLLWSCLLLSWTISLQLRHLTLLWKERGPNLAIKALPLGSNSQAQPHPHRRTSHHTSAQVVSSSAGKLFVHLTMPKSAQESDMLLTQVGVFLFLIPCTLSLLLSSVFPECEHQKTTFASGTQSKWRKEVNGSVGG